MSENVPKWANDLALDVYKVIQQHEGMPRFREMVDKCVADHETQIDDLQEW
jgi:hypothetical protein